MIFVVWTVIAIVVVVLVAASFWPVSGPAKGARQRPAQRGRR